MRKVLVVALLGMFSVAIVGGCSKDSNGKMLASSDDTALLMQDAAVSYVSPKDAVCVIEMRDTSYGGPADTPYRLHIGSFPRPTAVYPAGGKAGEELEVTFFGDSAGEFKQKVKLPGEPVERWGLFAEKDGEI